MLLTTTRDKLVVAIGLILMTGFIGINLANYYVSSRSVRAALINNELPLTSNNIYSEIQVGLLRPIYLSSLMANDTFLKDWMLDGEEDVGKIVKYLQEIKEKYGVFSTFLVSDVTRRYYYYGGILKEVDSRVPKDAWFFTMADHPGSYRVDVDYNEANRNQLTIFVNHKVFDYDGRFLGVTGLGIDTVSVAEMIQRYKKNFQRNIYFVDHRGLIKSHEDDRLIDQVNIRAQPGIAAVADTLLAGDSGFLMYEQGSDNILLSYRFIPELDWFLVVEQPESEALRPIRHALYFNIGASIVVTTLVLLISGYTVNLFQVRLERMAKTDKLTGLVNRHYFDVVFEYAIKGMARHKGPLGLAIFDIDGLKQINDRYGHLEGDRVIKSIADITRGSLRKTDVISRWGGDEFAVLLHDCDEATAVQLLDAMRENIKDTAYRPAADLAVTISVGATEYREGDTCATLLERADAHLYRAKHAGRNRVVAAAAEA